MRKAGSTLSRSRSMRISAVLQPTKRAIALSATPIFLAAISVSRSSAAMPSIARSFCSMRTMFCTFLRNQMSILVTSWMCSIVTPRRSASATTNERSVSISRSLLSSSSSLSASSAGVTRLSLPISSERTALSSAFSKFVPMAMISPVAFIFVPMCLSA